MVERKAALVRAKRHHEATVNGASKARERIEMLMSKWPSNGMHAIWLLVRLFNLEEQTMYRGSAGESSPEGTHARTRLVKLSILIVSNTGDKIGQVY